MPRVASVFGEDHAQNVINGQPPAHDWLCDVEQLASWQEQLVDSCNQIHQQLTGIRDELQRDSTPAIPFRLIRECSTNEEIIPTFV